MPALPSSQLGQRLCSIFSHPWRFIESSVDDSSSEPKWSTNTKHPLKPRVLWAKHQDANTLIGVRHGLETNYFLLDVDYQSAYLGQLDFILDSLETIGIVRTVILQSSWSKGIHIYAPLPRKYNSFALATAISSVFAAQGILIAPGQLEIFPNMKPFAKSWLGEFSHFAAHRLPLQPGSGSLLLDSDLQPIDQADSLSRFFAMWDNAAQLQNEEMLDQAIAVAKNNRRRRRRSVGPVDAWKADLELTLADGWTAHGQTNHLLKEIGTYGRVFLGLAGVELAEFMQRTAEQSPGYERWCRHQNEIWRRCCVWGRAIEGYYWPVGSEPLRERRSLASVREALANDARERIAAAVAVLGGCVGTIKAYARELCKAARCSQQTLYRNPDLWHPNPPAPPEPADQGVTAPTAGLPGPLGAIHREIMQSLEQADLAWVTPLTPDNEMWGGDFGPFKNLKSGSGWGGAGGEGLSTGSDHA